LYDETPGNAKGIQVVLADGRFRTACFERWVGTGRNAGGISEDNRGLGNTGVWVPDFCGKEIRESVKPFSVDSL
jgi:hypothetical protein